MLLFRAHCRKYLFFRFSNVTAWSWWKPWRRRPTWQRRNFNRWCHQPEHQSLPVSGLTSMKTAEGDCCLHHPIIADHVDKASATLGYSMYFHRTSWPAALLRWQTFELLNWGARTKVIPIFQCWLMLGSSGRRASWRGKTKAFILFILCWSRNYGRV